MRLICIYALVLAAAQGACGRSARPDPVPPPAPPATGAAPVRYSFGIHICVLQQGELRIVQAEYNTRTGDTTVNGRPFSEVYGDTAGYAAGAEWYVLNEPITVHGRRHVKYGIPRIIVLHELTRAGEFRGVPLFVQAGHAATRTSSTCPCGPGASSSRTTGTPRWAPSGDSPRACALYQLCLKLWRMNPSSPAHP